jgi:hypothetical protein
MDVFGRWDLNADGSKPLTSDVNRTRQCPLSLVLLSRSLSGGRIDYPQTKVRRGRTVTCRFACLGVAAF